MTIGMRLGVAALICAAGATAQNTVQGPQVGWIWDENDLSIRAILGIPGSSVMAEPYQPGFAVKTAAIAGNGESALLVGDEEQQVFGVSLREPGEPRRLPIPAGASRIALSSQGLAGAVYYASSGKLMLLKMTQPEAAFVELDLSTEGAPEAIAVADDAAGVAIRVAGGVMMVRADGNRWKLEGIEQVLTIGFMDNSSDLLIAGGNGTVIVSDAFGTGKLRVLREKAALAAAASNARKVLVLEESGLVAIDMETGAAGTVECTCTPTTVNRLSNSIFRVNEYGNGPVWLADSTQELVRTVFVPAGQ
ncbi:MAG: hypothetical protein HY820_22660 [Acidobacteria bacterium]|nr:hypothetical protein [Acidobacteriota bacterium]